MYIVSTPPPPLGLLDGREAFLVALFSDNSSIMQLCAKVNYVMRWPHIPAEAAALLRLGPSALQPHTPQLSLHLRLHPGRSSVFGVSSATRRWNRLVAQWYPAGHSPCFRGLVTCVESFLINSYPRTIDSSSQNSYNEYAF